MTASPRPAKVAVTGSSWVDPGEVIRKLDRELRIHPTMTLVTQPHFLKKVLPWAKARKLTLECVPASNRFTGNEALLRSGAMEFLCFGQDRFMQHLQGLLAQSDHRPLVRIYTTP